MRNWSFSISLLLCILSLSGCTSAKEGRSNAIGNAKALASATGGSVIDCSGIDSDMDHYVTCSIKSSKNEIIEIQCSDLSEAGCKMQKGQPRPNYNY